MHLEQLIGKYQRLRDELAQAYRDPAWDTSHIDRLSEEIVATERALAKAQPLDEQTNDLIPGLFL